MYFPIKYTVGKSVVVVVVDILFQEEYISDRSVVVVDILFQTKKNTLVIGHCCCCCCCCRYFISNQEEYISGRSLHDVSRNCDKNPYGQKLN